MAHFAHLDENNVVKHVSVVSNDIETASGALGDNDMHVDGETWCKNFHENQKWTIDNGVVAWKQCSYNKKFRKQMASINGKYDPVRDEFIAPQDPEKTNWVLNATNDWVSPLANNPPTDEGVWDDDNQRWVRYRESSGQTNPDVWNTSTQQWDLGS